MRKILLSIIVTMLFSFFNFSNALNAPQNLVLVKSTDDSIELKWDKDESAYGYYLYYGKESGLNSTYENEVPEIIDTSSYVIENLEASTEYYFSVVSIDENGEESQFSNETILKTKELGNNGNGKFGLKELEILSYSEIMVTFNSDLDSSDTALRDFRLLNKSNGEELEIELYELQEDDNSKVLITFAPDMNVETDYELTVIFVEDKNGRSIETGIYGVVIFSIPETFKGNGETIKKIITSGVDINNETELTLDTDGDGFTDIEENEAGTNPVDANDTPTLNVTTGDDGVEVKIGDDGVEVKVGDDGVELNAAGNVGVEISNNDLAVTTDQTAGETDNLPKTGPESVILALIAILLGGVMLFFLSKRKA